MELKISLCCDNDVFVLRSRLTLVKGSEKINCWFKTHVETQSRAAVTCLAAFSSVSASVLSRSRYESQVTNMLR